MTSVDSKASSPGRLQALDPVGLLSSHSRLHGSSSYRVPWLVDEESCEVLRTFTRLKHRLMPYLYAKAIEASQTGVPMMRPMVMEHPQDPACTTLDRQYQLGEALLVAPVFNEAGEVDFYLPGNGVWTHLLSGERREGGRWQRETHDFLSLPLYVAPATVLPWGAEDDKRITTTRRASACASLRSPRVPKPGSQSLRWMAASRRAAACGVTVPPTPPGSMRARCRTGACKSVRSAARC